jgi:hypothetical protein
LGVWEWSGPGAGAASDSGGRQSVQVGDELLCPGGHLANLAPLIGEVAGITSTSISFDRSERSLRADVADILHMEAEELVGMDGAGPGVITNPALGVVTQPVLQGRAGNVSYRGAWDKEFSGTNSFITSFSYAS